MNRSIKFNQPPTKILIVFILMVMQISCGNPRVALPTPAITDTIIPATNTTTTSPTQTATPSRTPTPTPVVTGIWTEAPSLLIPHSAHAVTNTATAIYALAGTDDHGSPVLDVEAFDGNQWTTETTLLGPGLNAPTASIVNDRLYVVGGFTATTNRPTDEVQVYNLKTRKWSMAALLPNPRGGHAAVVLDNKIHVLGGGNSVSTIANHSVYDPATNTWKELAPLPRAEGSPAAVV